MSKGGPRQAGLDRVARLMREVPFSKLGYLLQAEIHRRQDRPALTAAARRNFAPANVRDQAAYVKNAATRLLIPGDAALSIAALGLPDLALQTLKEGMGDARSFRPEAASACGSGCNRSATLRDVFIKV